MPDTKVKDDNTISNVEIRLKLAALDSIVTNLVASAARDAEWDRQISSMQADLRWLKWFVFAQAGATIGMLFKLFAS